MFWLNNREISWLFWLAVLFAWSLTRVQVRHALWQCVKAFCAPQILKILMLMLVYVFVCIIMLATLHLWRWDNLKTTVLWVITFALVTVMDASRISEDDTFYGRTIRETVTATAALIFIAELETFPLIAELFLVPAMVFLGLLLAFPQMRQSAGSVSPVIEAFAAVLGIGLLIYGFHAIWSQPEVFLTWATLREFFVPIALSLLFLPFAYALSLYVVYERMTLRLAWLMPQPELRSYAKMKAFFAFAGDLESTRRWIRNIGMLQSPTRVDIDAAIHEVLEARLIERSPLIVPSNLGWSPYSAKAFLEAEGLPTDDYHKSFDDLWHATSKLKELDTEPFSSNMAYAVEGNKTIATCLKLSLNVNNTSEEHAAKETFAQLTRTLVLAALPNSDAENIVKAARAGSRFTQNLGGVQILISRDDWRNGKLSGYALRLSITHHSAKADALRE